MTCYENKTLKAWAEDEKAEPGFRLQAQFWVRNPDLIELLKAGITHMIETGQRSKDDRSSELAYTMARFGWLVKKAREL